MNPCHPGPSDLRHVFARALALTANAPEGEPPSPSDQADTDPAPAGAGTEGEGANHESVESDDEPDDEPDHEPVELTADEARVPRIKQLSDEAAKWRRKFRQTEERVKALEDGQATEALRAENRSLRLRMAWDRATSDAQLRDADAAWKLAEDDLKAVEIKDDGTVDTNRIGEIVTYVITRYPYLVDQEPEPAPPSDGFPNTRPSGPRTNGKARQNTTAMDMATLQKKFPALRSRR